RRAARPRGETDADTRPAHAGTGLPADLGRRVVREGGPQDRPAGRPRPAPRHRGPPAARPAPGAEPRAHDDRRGQRPPPPDAPGVPPGRRRRLLRRRLQLRPREAPRLDGQPPEEPRRGGQLPGPHRPRHRPPAGRHGTQGDLAPPDRRLARLRPARGTRRPRTACLPPGPALNPAWYGP